MMDISRCKVPTMDTLKSLVDLFASLKINQFQLYMEHTFAFSAHGKVWADASPLTAEEIVSLDRYCADRFIELVPNFNSFGHFERWLRHPEYHGLAECPDGYTHHHHRREHGSVLKPDDASICFLDRLYEEFLPNFSSRLFNIGCDETWELGQGWSKSRCEKLGATRVYLDYLQKLVKTVEKHGRTPMFWGDIILKEPELVKKLPKQLIALEWGYDAGHPFDEHGKCFRSAGIPLYVCPGTSAWNSIVGRLDNCRENLQSAAVNGRKYGAIGYLNTDWGDGGHHQTLPISFPGYFLGAAYSWNAKQGLDTDLGTALSALALHEPTGRLADVLLRAGNTYRLPGPTIPNSTLFNAILFSPLGEHGKTIDKRGLGRCRKELEGLLEELACIAASNSTASLAKAEVTHSIKLALLAVRKEIFAENPKRGEPKTALARSLLEMIASHEALWLARNRNGGLHESSLRLRKRLADFA
jgi:hypothetical protein